MVHNKDDDVRGGGKLRWGTDRQKRKGRVPLEAEYGKDRLAALGSQKVDQNQSSRGVVASGNGEDEVSQE